MRRHSLSGPLLLLLIGAFFLWRNLHPEAPVFDLLAQYWPFLLIAWGLLRVAEVVLLGHRGSSFSGGEIVLIVFICVIGSGLWEGHRHGIRYDLGGVMIGEEYDYPIAAQAPAGNIRYIVFDNPRGNIKVTGADTQEIVVSGRKQIHAWGRTSSRSPSGTISTGVRPLVWSASVRPQAWICLRPLTTISCVSAPVTLILPRGLSNTMYRILPAGACAAIG